MRALPGSRSNFNRTDQERKSSDSQNVIPNAFWASTVWESIAWVVVATLDFSEGEGSAIVNT